MPASWCTRGRASLGKIPQRITGHSVCTFLALLDAVKLFPGGAVWICPLPQFPELPISPQSHQHSIVLNSYLMGTIASSFYIFPNAVELSVLLWYSYASTMCKLLVNILCPFFYQAVWLFSRISKEIKALKPCWNLKWIIAQNLRLHERMIWNVVFNGWGGEAC